jgi:hypothetical protein
MAFEVTRQNKKKIVAEYSKFKEIKKQRQLTQKEEYYFSMLRDTVESM